MGKLKEKLGEAKEYVKENWKPILKKVGIAATVVLAAGAGAVLGFKAGQTQDDGMDDETIPELPEGTPEEESPFEEEEFEEEEESEEEEEDAE